jgi:hypothetical protein
MHALPLHGIVAPVPVPAGRAGHLAEQVRVARVARLPRVLPSAVDHHRRTVHGAREVHQEPDLHERQHRARDDRRALARCRAPPQVDAAVEPGIARRAELHEGEVAAQRMHHLLHPSAHPLLVLHRAVRAEAGAVQRDLARTELAGGALLVGEMQVRPQDDLARELRRRTHLRDDVLLRDRTLVALLIVTAIVDVPRVAAHPLRVALVALVVRHDAVHVRVADEQLREARHHPDGAIAATPHLAQHRGAHQVVAERLAIEMHDVARPSAADQLGCCPRSMLQDDTRDVRG